MEATLYAISVCSRTNPNRVAEYKSCLLLLLGHEGSICEVQEPLGGVEGEYERCQDACWPSALPT